MTVETESAKTSEQQTQTTATTEVTSQTTDNVEGVKAEVSADNKTVSAETASFDDLKLSEGSLLEQAELDSLKEYAKANNLTKEQAAAILTREESLVTGYREKLESIKDKTVSEWGEQIKNDPELGGEKLESSKKLAQAVIKEFGDDGFIQQLEESGFGNHPGLFKLLHKVGKVLKLEPSELAHGKSTVSAQSGKSLEERWYGGASSSS